MTRLTRKHYGHWPVALALLASTFAMAGCSSDKVTKTTTTEQTTTAAPAVMPSSTTVTTTSTSQSRP
jgi:uncharacterized lipoprotein YajG